MIAQSSSLALAGYSFSGCIANKKLFHAHQRSQCSQRPSGQNLPQQYRGMPIIINPTVKYNAPAAKLTPKTIAQAVKSI
jgi:hypothetical protein